MASTNEAPMTMQPDGSDESYPERIYTITELFTEKPKGDLLLRSDMDGRIWKVFQCHGCQTCWMYIEDPGGNPEKDRVVQDYPHFLSMAEIPQ